MTTREQVASAYADHRRQHGINSALDAVEAVSGQLFLDKVPDDQLDALLAKLTAAQDHGGRMAARGTFDRAAPFKSVHARLAEIGAKVFAR